MLLRIIGDINASTSSAKKDDYKKTLNPIKISTAAGCLFDASRLHQQATDIEDVLTNQQSVEQHGR